MSELGWIHCNNNLTRGLGDTVSVYIFQRANSMISQNGGLMIVRLGSNISYICKESTIS